MQRQSTVSLWCERIIEGCWLLALTLIPIYFNLFSARHFEPDKATTLRSLVLVMLAAGLVRLLDSLNQRETTAPPSSDPRNLFQRFVAFPLALPTLIYALVFLITTLTSVVPLTSFWGSYQRLQGTYTNLSYVGLFVIIVATLRRREQLERIVTITLLTGMAVGSYGVLQHFQLDPLPWRGDVITRVASTLGNSIFVAAYMIMVVPFALFRLARAIGEARGSEPSDDARRDWLWALAQMLLIGGTLALLLAIVKFGAAVRSVDFRYWWAFPGMVAVVTALWTTLTTRGDSREGRTPLWPAVLSIGYLLFFALFFAVSAASGQQQTDITNTNATDWWLWGLIGMVLTGAFYALAYRLPRRSAPSRLAWKLQAAGAGALVVLLLVAVFFTQSRGPWIGLGVGLFVFVTLVMLQLIRYAHEHDLPALVQRVRIALGAWVGLTLAVGGFLIVFNISDAPFFQELRQTPYVGRMGRLLEVDSGTGLVRRLIWTGDEHAGGAVALITAEPLRTLIGWGPESMFVAFNPFYPPSLANIEARGASPDRSHQALLDELVTKGVFGLASYFFLIGSFVALAWRLMRRSSDWRWQIFFIATLSSVTCYFVEGLTGIPIVATLMMFWTVLALTVTGGGLAGHYPLSLARVPDPVVEPTPAPGTAKAKGSKRGAPMRGKPSTGTRRGAAATNPAALGIYGLVALLTLGAVWWFNLSPVYADMRFQEGQSYAERTDAGLTAQVRGIENYLVTIRSNPREDFYFLNLGRILMSTASAMRAQNGNLGEPMPDARVEDLLRLNDTQAIANFVSTSSPLKLMSYAESVLTRAYELNPRNKDHYANLGRINNFWYSWTNDPERLRTSISWYERVQEIAPQDVTLLNEYAGQVAQMGTYLEASGDSAQANGYYDRALALLQRSKELDQRYLDTDARLGDVYRTQGKLTESADVYVDLIGRAPLQLTNSIERIAADYEGQPELIRQLRDAYAERAAFGDNELTTKPADQIATAYSSGNTALLHAIAGLLSVRAGDLDEAVTAYERAASLSPQSFEYRRNYTIVLSDTQQYDRALAEAQATLGLIQGQQGRESDSGQIQALIAYLQQQAAGGR
jgi:tetratricopeptide (TPR) repeat protein